MPFAYYDRLSAAKKRIYRASDAIDAVPVSVDASVGAVVGRIRQTLEADDRRALRDACQDLANHLTRGWQVPQLMILVLAKRPADDSGELHGLYEPGDDGAPARISVWMRTAQRRQIVAFKSFVRTLCHELCHHLDYELCGFEGTFHTEGFYKRESSLANALLAQLPAASDVR